MNTCRYERDLERWFDGEYEGSEAIESHVEECAVCSNVLERMRLTRQAVRSVSERHEISDGQVPAFLTELRGRVERPRQSYAGVWAFASIAAAALVVSISTLVMFSEGPAPVEARTVIEEVTTEIDGATTSSYYSEDGTATVWVNVPEGDMW